MRGKLLLNKKTGFFAILELDSPLQLQLVDFAKLKPCGPHETPPATNDSIDIKSFNATATYSSVANDFVKI